ncbi:MAG: NAD(+) synthase [Lachnospiraceae bacterium]|nr:NAD(+) synthase [Lachnospiraceae bacterium]
MKHGFIKVAAGTPKIKVANPEYNRQQSFEIIKDAVNKGAKVVVLPELVLSSYTCNDLFLQDTLLCSCKEQLDILMDETASMDAIIFVGMPWDYMGKLYNVAAVVYKGELLALVTKTFIPNYSEFYEGRYFTPGPDKTGYILYKGKNVPFGSDILFQNALMEEMVIGCEICEDVWVPESPGTRHAMSGATIIVNLSASDETVGKNSYRRNLVSMSSAKLLSGYIYTSAGEGESTQDIVFGGHNIIAENGYVLNEAERFNNGLIIADIDVSRLQHERRKMNTFSTSAYIGEHVIVSFEMEKTDNVLDREFAKMPFVPGNTVERDNRCEEILNIQCMGLKKRLEHTGCKHAVIGVSGGLDSTLALIVIVRVFDMLGIPRENIETITMPCFGTTNRTYDNSCKLMNILGTHFSEINIEEAVNIHFRDINHDKNNHDVTYENSQARERTQILMDVANKVNGMVIGTGDMSELALGWATYNGDHMSMYAVNVGIPKTLVRYLVQYSADNCEDAKLQAVLRDILDTPVSPELIPPVDGKISQKTEELVGDYILHDYFLYYMLRCGYSPDKIYRIATRTFDGQFDKETILKWEKNFYRRFFAQQFKRSCIPDGPKVGSVALSPRGDLRMPSDASVEKWMNILDTL